MKKPQRPAAPGNRAGGPPPQSSAISPAGNQASPIRKVIIVAAVLLLASLSGASFLLGRKSAQVHCPPVNTAAPDAVSLVHPGPWGNLEYIPITIAAPEEFLGVQQVEHSIVHWVFPGFTAESMAGFLDTVDLTPGQRERMLKPEVMKRGAHGLHLFPPAELALSISTKGRQQLCAQLAQFPENNPGLEVITAKSFDEHFVKSGVSESTVALVHKLACPYRSYLIFPDLPYVLAAIPTYPEKLNLLKAISRQQSLLVKLHVTPDTDIKALASYYGKACWGKDVTPLLESLARIPGGARIDFAHLIPPLPSSLLYTFPLPNGPDSTNVIPDCHWTSFNFFRDPPDPRYSDPAFIHAKMQSDFYIVPSDPRYGDIVFFTKPDGIGIHSAVFLFDNIVFTKNGANVLQPWKLATIDELLDEYSFRTTPDKPLRIVYYRNKYY